MAFDGAGGFAPASNLQGLGDTSLPIFDVDRVVLQFAVSSDFVAAQVANNVLVLALSTGRILRIDLDSPADIDGERIRLANCDLSSQTNHNRHRPPEEDYRNRRRTASLLGSVRIPPDHHHLSRRELLPTYPIAAAKNTFAPERNHD